jgi:hypothetical protein
MGSAPERMKKLLFGLLILTWSASPGWAAGLTLSIQDGKVSINAEDVTIRQILTEWARLGKTQIINLERVVSGPITVKFDALPEKQALDIILRTVPGYLAAPRESYLADASVYDRILIMATTTTVAATTTTVAARPQLPYQGSPQTQSPNLTQLRAMPPALTPGALPEDPADDQDQQDDAALAAAAAAGLVAVPALPPPPGAMIRPRPTGPATAQQPAPTATSPVATPSNPWNAPIGTERPGLAPPPPPAPEAIAPPLMRPFPPQADR